MDLHPAYDKLVSGLAEHMYKSAYASLKYQQHMPWEKMVESQRQPYYEIAMNAMGYLFGVGEWEKKACNQPEVVMFIQVR